MRALRGYYFNIIPLYIKPFMLNFLITNPRDVGTNRFLIFAPTYVSELNTIQT